MNRQLRQQLQKLDGANDVIVRQDAVHPSDGARWCGRLNVGFSVDSAEIKIAGASGATFEKLEVVGVDVRRRIIYTKVGRGGFSAEN